MPGYQVRFQNVDIGDTHFQIRSLLDRQQYHDPDGEAERAGISPSSWPLFGQIWPSARVLAGAMCGFAVDGKRILEIGAGLALASLIVHKRRGNMTASDAHPLGRAFFDENLRLNALAPMDYMSGNWATLNPGLACFDLIIGSDVLYERDQPVKLAAFINSYAAPSAEILIVDPDRGNRAPFRRAMDGYGFAWGESRADCVFDDGEAYKGRFLHFHRQAV